METDSGYIHMVFNGKRKINRLKKLADSVTKSRAKSEILAHIENVMNPSQHIDDYHAQQYPGTQSGNYSSLS